jgi:hypothetical protein
MNKLNNIKRGLFALVMCLSLTLCGCGSKEQTEDAGTSSAETQQSEDVSAEEVMIDYGDAESFEAALNEGKNLEGKVVRFIAGEFHPQSKLGYNVWAGEHLNFVSSRNPDIQEGDTVTVKTTTIENMAGSWVINYEKVENAVVGEDTITYSKPKETTAATTTAKPKTTTTATTTAEEEKTEAETSAPNEPAEEKAENTYEHNEYYDIVETSSFQNSIGTTIVIHKVLAKKDVSVSATLLAYGSDGNVIGKSSDDIVLTAGQNNFFRYSFEGDISSASIQANAQAKKDSFMTGERNAVEMVQYNQSGDDLYITFKQNVDELDYFAKFKLLFYKGDKIVDTEDGYFNIYAENLNGNGATDVAKIWAYGIDYDRIEYIFEP